MNVRQLNETIGIETADLRAENERLRAALTELVGWKKHKDELGTTDSYRYQIDAAWKRARAALDQDD